ncbi:MAG: recombinase zinc beta ribbon domain-containing protein [Erythrobacter sp.]
MTISGTTRRNRRYSYYSCAGSKLKGKCVCKGRHIPMEKLDTMVTEGLADKLLVPDRVEDVLRGLMERASAKDHAVKERRHQLEAEIETVTSKLSRLYSAIEDGIVDLDEELKERIDRLKTKRDIAKASLQQITLSTANRTAITPQKIAAFTDLMRHRLRNGDVRARKDWIGSIVDKIEIDDDAITIIGNKHALIAALAGQNQAETPVRGFVRKWRARQDSNLLPQD